MALNLAKKQEVVSYIQESANKALSLVVANVSGVPANQLTELRKAAREVGVNMKIFRNTLIRRALENSSYACLMEILIGPTLLAFSNEHPGAAARLFKEFIKKNGNTTFKIKAAAFDGKLISAEQIDKLATLPTYEEAIARLMATMLEAAAGKLVRTLAAVKESKNAI